MEKPTIMNRTIRVYLIIITVTVISLCPEVLFAQAFPAEAENGETIVLNEDASWFCLLCEEGEHPFNENDFPVKVKANKGGFFLLNADFTWQPDFSTEKFQQRNGTYTGLMGSDDLQVLYDGRCDKINVIIDGNRARFEFQDGGKVGLDAEYFDWFEVIHGDTFIKVPSWFYNNLQCCRAMARVQFISIPYDDESNSFHVNWEPVDMKNVFRKE